MNEHNRDMIGKAYQSFNNRDIPHILSFMHPDICWPNVWEGGYIKGHIEIRSYWTRLWQEINPNVKPLSLREDIDGQIEVMAHQIVKGLKGNVLSDSIVKHVYTFENGLIKRMEIQKP